MGEIAGDPAAVREAALRLRRAVAAVGTAVDQLAGAREAARAGWSGPAARTFDAAVDSAARRTALLARLADAAGPLEAYAADLEAAQHAAGEPRTLARSRRRGGCAGARRQAPDTADTAPTLAPDDLAPDDAARAAADRAAAGVDLTAAAFSDGFTAAQSARAATGSVVGQGLGAVSAHLGVVAQDSSDVLDVGAATSARTGAGLASGAGGALGVVGAGATQWLRDADDPQYSPAQRSGRAATAAVTIGGGSILGAMAAGALVGSVVPVGGTIVGALTGLAAGAVGGLVGGLVADAVDDGSVDAGGDLAGELASEADGS